MGRYNREKLKMRTGRGRERQGRGKRAVQKEKTVVPRKSEVLFVYKGNWVPSADAGVMESQVSKSSIIRKQEGEGKGLGGRRTNRQFLAALTGS